MKTITQTKTITHHKKLQLEGELCNEWMMNNLSIDLLAYNTIIYELGIEFLNEIFPENKEAYKNHFSKHSQSVIFWKWWRREFDFELQDFVKFIIEHKPIITPEIFLQEMRQLVHASRTEESFYQYLKLF